MDELEAANVHVYTLDVGGVKRTFVNNHMYPSIKVDELDAYFDYVERLGNKLTSVGGTFHPERSGPGPSHSYVEVEVTPKNIGAIVAAVRSLGSA